MKIYPFNSLGICTDPDQYIKVKIGELSFIVERCFRDNKEYFGASIETDIVRTGFAPSCKEEKTLHDVFQWVADKMSDNIGCKNKENFKKVLDIINLIK